ncbi:hypothetical protein K2X89_07200 [Myxococcota bacterium]|nr:hypothetical protein [Myxococcota bacterium]
MIRKLIRYALIAFASIAALVASIAIVARFSDGPIFVFPGGPLVNGEKVEYASVDWEEFVDVREIEFQLESPPRSRITRMTIHDGKPYVPCAFCTNRMMKRWPRELERDDRVVIRANGKLIEGRARRVPQDSPEYRAARDAHLAKFGDPNQTLNIVESGAATIVVGAGQASSGHEGAPKTDSWMYRIDPR